MVYRALVAQNQKALGSICGNSVFLYCYLSLTQTGPHDLVSGSIDSGLLRAVKNWELFCPRTPLIKTVMRLFTAASNYSQLWLCSFDYDSHE